MIKRRFLSREMLKPEEGNMLGRLVAIAMMAAVVMLAACGESATATPEATPTTAVTTKEVTLGMAVPLSGFGVGWGLPSMNAANLIFDKVNAGGGLKVGDTFYKPKVIAYDTKLDPAEALAVTRRLVEEDNVRHVFMVTEPEYQAAKDYMRDQGVWNIRGGWGAADIVNPDYPLAFRVIYPVEAVTDIFLTQARSLYPNAKRLAVAAIDNFTAEVHVEAAIKPKAPDFGFEIVAHEVYPLGATDLTAVMARLIAAEPDIIFISSFEFEVYVLQKAAAELGWRGPTIYASPLNEATLLGIGGPAGEPLDNYILSNPAEEAWTFSMKQFRQDYLTKFGGEFPFIAMDWGSIVADAFLEGIRLAGTDDPQAMAKALQTTSEYSTTAWGSLKPYGAETAARINNHLVHPMPVSIYRDGELQFLTWGTP